MRLRALVLVGLVVLVAASSAHAVTISWHTVPGNWEGGGQFNPHPEATSEAMLAAALKVPIVQEGPPQPGEFPNLSTEHFGEAAGWWCEWGEVHAPTGAVYNIPNPHAITIGSWGAPACRSMTLLNGEPWFTDPGTESVGRLAGNTITEYPLPLLPVEAEGYPGDSDRYPTPGAITAEGSTLWVATATGKGIYSVNPTTTATTARVHGRRHRRRHRRS
jgi:hypothetical protein